MKFKYFFILAISFMFIASTNAQKFGYINSNELLSLHPDVKAADSKLQDYQKQLLSVGQKMAGEFQKHYQSYVEVANKGQLSKIQMQEKESALTQEQNKIRAYEAEMQQKLIKKREEIYKPILDKIQGAINAVGKENGYTFIFDAGTGGILNAKENTNVIGLVKAKLGI